MEYNGKYKIVLDQLALLEVADPTLREESGVKVCDRDELDEINDLREIVEQLAEPAPATFTLS